MKEIADFIREREIEHEWQGNHFYIWPTYRDMEDLKDIIPWGMTEFNMLDGCAISPNGVCVDLAELFWHEEIEKFFPHSSKKEV